MYVYSWVFQICSLFSEPLTDITFVTTLNLNIKFLRIHLNRLEKEICNTFTFDIKEKVLSMALIINGS